MPGGVRTSRGRDAGESCAGGANQCDACVGDSCLCYRLSTAAVGHVPGGPMAEPRILQPALC